MDSIKDVLREKGLLGKEAQVQAVLRQLVRNRDVTKKMQINKKKEYPQNSTEFCFVKLIALNI